MNFDRSASFLCWKDWAKTPKCGYIANNEAETARIGIWNPTLADLFGDKKEAALRIDR